MVWHHSGTMESDLRGAMAPAGARLGVGEQGIADGELIFGFWSQARLVFRSLTS